MNEIRDVPDVVDCRGLRVVVWRSAGWTGLDLTGDIDLASAPTLITTLDGLLADGARHLALDLTYVDFFGVQALRVLDDLERRCRRLHGRLVLVEVSPHVRRVLVLLNAQRLLDAVLPERVGTGAGTRTGRADAGGHDERPGRPGLPAGSSPRDCMS
jgi:anti-sigma B factor antagonist